jgi:hypothetical protein
MNLETIRNEKYIGIAIITLEHCCNQRGYNHNFGILHQSETLTMLKSSVL